MTEFMLMLLLFLFIATIITAFVGTVCYIALRLCDYYDS